MKISTLKTFLFALILGTSLSTASFSNEISSEALLALDLELDSDIAELEIAIDSENNVLGPRCRRKCRRKARKKIRRKCNRKFGKKRRRCIRKVKKKLRRCLRRC